VKVLFQSIYSHYTTNITSGALVNRLYFNEAPQGEKVPYVVYRMISLTPEVFFAGETHEEAIIEFVIYDDDNSCSDIADYYGTITTAFNYANITVTGYTDLIFEREYSSLERDIDNELWTYTIQYRVLLLKN
jgi:hypothetical protein